MLFRSVEISKNNFSSENKRVFELKRLFLESIMSDIADVYVNGSIEICVPNILNLRFGGVEGSALIQQLDLCGIACSAGAACSAGSVKSSHVLSAIGITEEEAENSVRFSFGRFTTEEEIAYAVAKLKSIISKIRKNQ